MGLCKCSKKKVTNLFCFEHRVNVCEFCLVSDHNKCIVQSYLQWLQDSDYSSDCDLCNKPLNEFECIRLSCYDIFHWHCLFECESQLPKNTAPAGYECPKCKAPIIPLSNTAGPVVDHLRSKLKDVPWARAGLGLPLIATGELMESLQHNSTGPYYSTPVGDSLPPRFVGATTSHIHTSYLDKPSFTLDIQEQCQTNKQIDCHSAAARKVSELTPPRGEVNASFVSTVPIKSFDSDEDKYRRRPFLGQWMRLSVKTPGGGFWHKRRSLRQISVLLVVALLFLFAMLFVLTRLGRNTADQDPMLDPAFNPNIRVKDSGPIAVADLSLPNSEGKL